MAQPPLPSTFIQNNAQRPSDGWLRNPAWIDGGVNPPRYYRTHHEIAEALQAAAPAARQTPNLAPVTMPEAAVMAAQPAVQNESLVDGSTAPAHHLVYVCMMSSVIEKPPGRNAKTSTKKDKTIKSDYIKIEGSSRADFIKAFFGVHDLSDQFSPGVHSGPPFKIWWSGSSGGRTNASTVEKDRDFEVSVENLLKKKKGSCVVHVEFDTDTLDGYRIRKRLFSQTETSQDQEDELLYGTRVPHVDNFSEAAQLHGSIIVQLKQKWTCEKHQGEHGEQGYCYVTPAGEHIGLNMRKLKMWAAAIAAADATKHEPPNTGDFDGLRDGRADTGSKPRGRCGPRGASMSTDPMTILLASMIPLITNQLSSVTRNIAATSASPSEPPSTPTRHSRDPSPPLSPAPAAGSEVQACLQNFLQAKGIDLLDAKQALTDFELTPDIIADIPVSRLCEVLGTVEGRARKYQIFAKEWSERLESKRRRLR
ncbi:hypothetical protein DEU56DRAFT_814656 [Suillus clintonianus]|uniref:uncharacterized protein n=1 Tax=Suillus clintonianus TaxID=1904413 RepID=UPI001B877BDC|nr:uncharacterized protein DEU56DRAFT_814656 [Suillus clintonianus]KAG2130852.1 hypothetical protein DEU56DRAFT_814656 [Suillus clintonianus]